MTDLDTPLTVDSSAAAGPGVVVPTPGPPAAVVGSATALVSGLVGTLWAARTPAELVETVGACERLRSVLDAIELAAVAEVEATGAAKTIGWASTRDFVTAVAGGHRGTGRRLLALATAVTGARSVTGTALAAGAISRAQAEVIVAAVDRLPGNPALRAAAEAVLLDQAAHADAAELGVIGARVLAQLDPDGEDRRDEAALAREDRAAHASRFLSITEDGIGGVRLKGRGTVEDAAHLKTMLFALAAPTPTSQPGACGATPRTPGTPAGAGSQPGACGTTGCAHDGKDPREHGTRMWDALIEASRLLTGTTLLPTSHGTRPRIGVTIDYHALRTGLDTGPGAGLLDTGERLSAAAVRRLACDADVLPYVLGTRSQILDVGRASRLVTLGLWLALIARDRQCAFPGCTRPPIACDAHHIRHWIDGGPTSLDNLVLLCRAHHRLLHTTPWQVHLNPTDHRPEFTPPPRLDPTGTPRRRQPLRT